VNFIDDIVHDLPELLVLLLNCHSSVFEVAQALLEQPDFG
jgi:hypothetical protein